MKKTANAAKRNCPLCDLHPKIVRGGPRTGVQFAAGAARSLRGLHQQPASRRLGLLAGGYDDGGFSGATMDRPALQQLLADVTAGRVDTVVVYKIDRLTRSLADFAKIVEILDARGASFVSVTQQFNTTTSMGRLTLNVLLSFAQFEREVIGERIRDKIAASKKKGMWMGGVPPLGYGVQDHKLVTIDGEADTVRLVFRRYAELGSVRLLRRRSKCAGSKVSHGRAPRGASSAASCSRAAHST